jgi:hypothetical protein
VRAKEESNVHVGQGGDRVRLFPGALEALRAVKNEECFKHTKVAAASSTTEPEWARKCLSLLEVQPGVKVNQVITYAEIYCSNKTKHFAKLKAATGVPYSGMLFFDDCTYLTDPRPVLSTNHAHLWNCPAPAAPLLPPPLNELTRAGTATTAGTLRAGALVWWRSARRTGATLRALLPANTRRP